MKNFKKVMALIIAMVMVLGMGSSVLAASITLTGEPENYEDNHTYNVYQIFTGDVVDKAEGSGTVVELQNVKYGESYGDTGASVPKGELDVISTEDNARAFAARLVDADPAVLKAPVATLTAANDFTAANLAPGYYLIVDTLNGDLEEGDVISQYIVKVLKDVEMNTKKDVPSTKKEITTDDHPTSEDSAQNPGISSDKKKDNVSIGDTVTFTITAKVPEHAVDYDYYYFVVGDNLSDGLTFEGITSIQVDGTDVKQLGASGVGEEDAECAVYLDPRTADGNDFEVALLKANTEAFAGKTITIVYTATLNEDAVIGGDGNTNTVQTLYSNNPNEDYDGTFEEEPENPDEPEGPKVPKPGKPNSAVSETLGETPAEVTKTFTSGVSLLKVDQDSMPLVGAEFTIEGDSINEVVTNSETFTADAEGTYYKLKTGAYTETVPQTADQMVAAPQGATDGYVLAEADYDGEVVTVGGTNYRVVASGETPAYILQKNNAALYESTTTLYKKESSEVVEQTTNHVTQNIQVNDDGTLNFKGLGAGTYTITETVVPDGYTKAADTTVVITFDNETKQFTATVNGTATQADAANLFPVTVKNVAGNVLPETGGIGTKIFYTLGSILVIGAGVILVTRRRMAAR